MNELEIELIQGVNYQKILNFKCFFSIKASKDGQIHKVKELLDRGVDIESASKNKCTPLFKGVKN